MRVWGGGGAQCGQQQTARQVWFVKASDLRHLPSPLLKAIQRGPRYPKTPGRSSFSLIMAWHSLPREHLSEEYSQLLKSVHVTRKFGKELGSQKLHQVSTPKLVSESQPSSPRLGRIDARDGAVWLHSDSKAPASEKRSSRQQKHATNIRNLTAQASFGVVLQATFEAVAPTHGSR